MEGNYRCYIATMVAVFTILLAVTGTGFADLRIVENVNGERLQTLYKGNRIASQIDIDVRSVLFCERQELAIISSRQGGRYWLGNVSEFEEELAGWVSATTELLSDLDFGDLGLGDWDFGEFGDFDFGDLGGFDLGGLFGELFASEPEPVEILVRVSKVGEETILGYAAEHYVVEVGSSGDWRVYEEVWVSNDLMQTVIAESPACMDFFSDIMSDIASSLNAFGIDEREAVYASADYQELMDRGIPVRRKESVMDPFGGSFELFSEVVEVSKDPVSEDLFVIPSGYRRVGTVFEVFDI